ncbi:MAG: hypothetical protein KDD94_00930, partial [Calditrichaeota bacterium]|nr:hypothetical protein [Calditrichota bacterium]
MRYIILIVSILTQFYSQSRYIDSLALISIYNNANGANWTKGWFDYRSIDTWFGVTMTGDRVTGLALPANNLDGTLPAEIGDLNELIVLDLRSNQLSGEIPAEIANLTKLITINLSDNNLTGSLPGQIGNLINIENVYLNTNSLDGTLPSSIYKMNKLKKIYLTDNLVSGPIPAGIDSLNNIEEIGFSNNHFEGTFPPIPDLNKLKYLYLSGNYLTGTFHIESLASLIEIEISSNILDSITTLNGLPNFQRLNIGNNKFDFDDIIRNEAKATNSYIYSPQKKYGRKDTVATRLNSSVTLTLPIDGAETYQWYKNGQILVGGTEKELNLNNITDDDFGSYQLETFNTNYSFSIFTDTLVLIQEFNRYSDSLALVQFYNSITNWGSDWDLNLNMETWVGIAIDNNRVIALELSGEGIDASIPSEIGNLTELTTFDLRSNNFTGTIPVSIGNLTKLNTLLLGDNNLSGSIPIQLGKLKNLIWLDLQKNNFSSQIPDIFGELGNIVTLELNDNSFTGNIPSVEGLDSLRTLNVSNNDLSGLIPAEIANLSNLVSLNLSSNNLTGSIPVEIATMDKLVKLNLSHNSLTDAIPSVTNLLVLESLNLSNNNLTGGIPNLNGLNSLKVFRVENNQLTSTNLYHLAEIINSDTINVSGNKFTGQFPVIDHLGNLKVLDISENFFDSIPVLTGLNNLKILKLQNNRFDFNDLIGNQGSASLEYSYSPQKIFGNKDTLTLALDASIILSFPGIGGQTFQWRKNGQVLAGATNQNLNLNPISESDFGDYTLQVSHSAFPGFSIFSDTITLKKNYHVADSLALVALYNSTNGANWTNSWDLNTAVSTWFGVTLANNRVVSLNLANNNLNGTIPAQLEDLIELTTLNLGSNQINGYLPTEFNNLSKLTSLDIHQNNLDSIPQLNGLTSLQSLKVGGNRLDFNDILRNDGIAATEYTFMNQAIFGDKTTIVAVLGSSVTLTFPDIGGDSFQWRKNGSVLTGATNQNLNLNTISEADFANYTLHVSHSSITGFSIFSDTITLKKNYHVADSLALIALYNSLDGANWDNSWSLNTGITSWYGVSFSGGRVVSINLMNNQLKGTVPSQLQNLTALTSLNLSSNQLEGSLLSTIAGLRNLPNLRVLNLSANNLSGTIPAELAEIDSLRELILNSNLLSGTIPASISTFLKLEKLDISSNQLTGAVPANLNNLGTLTDLILDHNQFNALPTFTGLNTLNSFSVGSNLLDFDDIERNIGIAAVYTYSPQDSVDSRRNVNRKLSETIEFTVTTNGENNLYQWFRNGNLLTGATNKTFSKAFAETSDIGNYVLRITNSLVNGLTIYSRPVTVSVQISDYVSRQIVSTLDILDGRKMTLDSNQVNVSIDVDSIYNTVNRIKVFYREIGDNEANFSQETLTNGAGSTVFFTSFDISTYKAGYEFYFTVEANNQLITVPENGLYKSQIRLKNGYQIKNSLITVGDQPDTEPLYNLISLPFVNDVTLRDVIDFHSLGKVNIDYKLLSWNNNTYVKADSTGSLANSKVYFIASKNPVAVRVPNTKRLDSQAHIEKPWIINPSSNSVTVWNIVSNPYPFAISVDDIIAANSGIPLVIKRYDGLANWTAETASILPNSGYAISA